MSNVYIDRVLSSEGGYVNHPQDPGGATNYGITEQVARAQGYRGDMRDMPRAFAAGVYNSAYWAKIRGADLPGALAYQVLDAAVNHGVTTAIKWLQLCVGTAPDGIIGPKTIDAVSRANLVSLLMAYISMRIEFYTKLPNWGAFGKGWVNRMCANLKYISEDMK